MGFLFGDFFGHPLYIYVVDLGEIGHIYSVCCWGWWGFGTPLGIKPGLYQILLSNECLQGIVGGKAEVKG